MESKQKEIDHVTQRIVELEGIATRKYVDDIDFCYILGTLNDEDRAEYDQLQKRLSKLMDA